MFEIIWSVSDTEWEKARRASSEHEAGSQYDRECSAHYYLLYATIAIRCDGSSLFERGRADAINVSVLDIGCQLAQVIVDVERTGRGHFSASDDGIEVSFTRDGAGVVLATDNFTPTFSVPGDEFLRVCQQFLSDVARSLLERTPKLLTWQSVAPIAAYATRGAGP